MNVTTEISYGSKALRRIFAFVLAAFLIAPLVFMNGSVNAERSFAAASAALSAPVETVFGKKAPEKDLSGATVGSTYHVGAPTEKGALPEQRSDIVPGTIECMDSAKSAVLIEATSGQKLLSSNPDERLPMASTTKTMTALVVLENCSPDEVVTVPREAVGVEGSSLYLAYGERLTVRDLLYGLMLRSGNDCAVALAIHTGGSVEGFAALMNERAERMGLVNTHFVTPNGLHDKEHYTTAYELALIGAEALRNPVFREIVTTQYYTFTSSIRTITVKNKNTMLWDYEGCLGIKTGYTSQAGRCLLFAAEKDGMTLVGCVMNCRPMFEVAPEMLDYGFENYSLVSAVRRGDEIARCEVEGSDDTVPLLAVWDVYTLMRNGKTANAEVRAELNPGVAAPIAEGQLVGTAGLYIGGVRVGEVKLAAGTGAGVRSFGFFLTSLLGLFGKGR